VSIDSLAMRLAFIRMDAETLSALRDIRPLITRVLPDILAEFYSHVLSFSAVSRLFPDQSVVRRASDMQIRHWNLIANAEFDDRYVASVTRVGQMHHRMGLGPQWYIGGYNYLISALLRAISLDDHASWRFRRSAGRRKKADQIAAVTKAGLLDMELATAVYLDAAMRAKQELVDQLLGAPFRRAIEAVSQATVQFEGTAHALTHTASSTKRLVSSAVATFDEVSSDIRNIASATNNLLDSSAAIAEKVNESNRITSIAVAQVEKADTCISALSEAADQIGGVAKLITEIAAQTNLLALNATIEAARAGAAGRGFSVVAQEVKTLATQTAKATDEIGHQIGQIETATRCTVTAMTEILGTIRHASEVSSAIAATLERQRVGTQDIFRSVSNISRGTSEVAASMERVTDGAMNTGAASESLLASVRGLTGESKNLKNEVESFLAAVQNG